MELVPTFAVLLDTCTLSLHRLILSSASKLDAENADNEEDGMIVSSESGIWEQISVR
jgi:hypothetical protein